MKRKLKNSKCGTCRQLIAGNCLAVFCEHTCKNWYHIECAVINEIEYQRLSICDEKWYCEKCELHISNSKLRKEVDNLNKTVQYMQSEIKEFKQAYDELSEQNKNLSEVCLRKEEEMNEMQTELDVLKSEKMTNSSRRNNSICYNRMSPQQLNKSSSLSPLSTNNRFACLEEHAEDNDS
ncbi:hypothetical protein LSTR_LSTR017217, partial [Laodelphax striatellus]